MNQFFPTLLLLLFLCGCQPKSIIGLYSTAQPDVMSFVNQELDLKEDGTFAYRFSSDDINSNKKGKGIYNYAEQKLVLNFKRQEEGLSSVKKNKASLKFTQVLKVLVQDLDNNPLIGVTLTLRDEKDKIILNGISNEKGYSVLKWKAGQTPNSLEVSYTGFSNLITPLDRDSALDYTISLSHTFRPIPAGTVWEYDTKLRKTRLRLTKEERTTNYYKRSEK